MQKAILLIFLLTIIKTASIGQKNQKGTIFSKKDGIIVFEGKDDVYDMYFINTSSKSLIDVLKKRDTVNIIMLGSSGDVGNNARGFKWFLDKNNHFDSAFLLISDTNHLGYGYEDTTFFYSKYGSIEYIKSLGHGLSKHFKKVYYKDRNVVFIRDYFVPVESFKAYKLSKKKIKRYSQIY